MSSTGIYRQQLQDDGFAVVNEVFSAAEVYAMAAAVSAARAAGDNFRQTADLFAIRNVFKEVPALSSLALNDKLKQLINKVAGDGYFVVKSIWFDKPGNSNWFVAWHQDLTIAVSNRAEIPGYTGWTVKPGQYAVQPPLQVLLDNFTIRIHLDDTDENNGALKVVSGSHKAIHRPENIDWSNTAEIICNVPAGGVMFMKPLLLHASSRTTNNKSRRVIHIEFSRVNLPDELQWAERVS